MDITFKPQKGFSASASTADDIMFAPQSHLESTYKGLEDDGTPDAFDFSEMQSDLALDEQGAFDFSSIEEGFDLEGALTSDVDPGDSQDLDYFSTEDPTLGLGDD